MLKQEIICVHVLKVNEISYFGYKYGSASLFNRMETKGEIVTLCSLEI